MARDTKTGGRKARSGVISGSYALAVGKPAKPLPNGWSWEPLTSLARLESGHTPSRRHPEYWGGEIPWIGIKDATSNYGLTIADTIQHTNQLGIDNSSARVLPTGTVCLSRTASVGYVIVMGQPMATSQDFVNWVCSDKLNNHFLKYILIAERKSLDMFSMGTTHQTIYFPEVKAFHIAKPPRAEQDEIVGVLSSLDDKIELNRRMNETLEAMARAVFKDWFVDFGPTRRKAAGETDPVAILGGLLPDPINAASLAALFAGSFASNGLPEGWSRTRLEELTTRITKGTTPRKTDLANARHEEMVRFYRVNNISDDGELEQGKVQLIPKAVHLGSLKRSILQTDDILYSIAGTIGRTHKVESHELPANVNQALAIIRSDPEKVPPNFVLLCLKMPQFRDDLHSNVVQAVQANLSLGMLSNSDVVIPSFEVLKRMTSIIDALLEKVQANLNENKTLAATRDLLLPKLMSGEIRLKNAGGAL